MNISYSSETITNPPDASVTIVKPSEAFGTILIDVLWDQNDPNNKNRKNGAIQCNLGRSEKLENEKIGISRIGEV